MTLRSVEIHEATTCETARAFLSDFGSPVSEDLTITMRGTGLVRVGIRCDSGSCSFRNTRIDIAGASLGQGVGVEDGSATFHDLTIRLDELAQRAEGILTVGGTGIGELRVSEARIVTGPDVGDAYGVHLFADGDTRIERSSIEVRGSGTGFGYGVHLSDPGPVLLSGLEIGVEGHDENVGLQVVSNDLEARGLGIVSTGGTSAIGIETRSSSGSYDVEIDGSSIRADHQTVQGDAEFAVSIGGSRLAGGAVDAGGGSIICAGVWDESSVFYPDTCP